MNEVEVGKAVSSKSRWDIIELLARETLSIEEIAERVGLASITVRHHIQALDHAGLVEPTERRGAFGRPKSIYKLSEKGVSIQFPKRQYSKLAEYLIEGLLKEFGSGEAAKIMKTIGYEEGGRLAKELSQMYGINEWTREDFLKIYVKGYLERLGSQPEIIETDQGKTTYVKHNCIFHGLAKRYSALICDEFEVAFNQGLCDGTIRDSKIRTLSCMAKGGKRCMFLIEKGDQN